MKNWNPFKNWTQKYDEKQRQLQIEEIRGKIQIREYEGRLFISYDNRPLIEQKKLKDDICLTLEEIRNNVLKYKGLL